MAINGLDSSVLLGFYQAQLSASPTAIAAGNARVAQMAASQKAAVGGDPPWNTPNRNNASQDAEVLSTTKYLDTSKVPLSAGATADSKLLQDNQKLFALYSAVNTLAYIAKMAQRPDATSGQLAGLNARFQDGMKQVQDYLAATSFNNFSLQAAKPTDSVTSKASIAFGDFSYATRPLVTDAKKDQPMAGITAADSFTITIKKGGVATDVAINMADVGGPLTLTNIVSHINNTLAEAGFATRFQKTQQGGTATSSKDATYGLAIKPGGVEQVSLSAAATPSLYMVGSSGLATETNTVTNATTSATTTTAADQAGRLTKLSLAGDAPTATFSVNQKSTGGTTTAQASVVDASGNIYVIGNATGDFGSQINQGTQDSYLTKYDSAGNVVWQTLLGSAGTASGYALALDPSGGVGVTGASTAALTPAAIANGNTDTFVARYDRSGNQSWIKQIPTMANNQASSVSVDASGNIYIGGTVGGFPVDIGGVQTILPGGVIGAGMVNQGGSDAYLVKLDSKGKILSEAQFGTSANDTVSATATGPDGSLYVASVQNGHAIIAKYAGGDITAAPTWTQDLGELQGGGAIGGLAVSGGQLYVSGATSNANLTAGGAASIAHAASGGVEAFVFSLTDNGTSASADRITYVGTSGTDTAGAVTVGADGTVYLTGSTTGTFTGAQRNIEKVTNAFVAAINPDGSIGWTKQFGGASGVSSGAGVAIDASGSSVLDALGLPRGTITVDKSVELTSQTSLRAGTSFQIRIEGPAPRTATITIDAGETFDSLSTKINAQLGAVGKAKTNYTGGGSNLKLSVNPGHTITLIAGPKDLDALARLGIDPGVLTAPAKDGTAAAAKANSDINPTYGLGFAGVLDISSRTGANAARSQLLAVLSALQSTYQTENKPEVSTTTVGNTSGKASSYQTAQLANYSLALSLLGR